MNSELNSLKPALLWKYFSEILEIPRPSKKEEKIIAYLLNFGKEQQLETLQDEIGNVLIRKPATAGMENRESVVLQSHMDMVCEKNSDKVHDFENDPIEAWIDDDGWVKAKGTTLGADDGIGIAAQLAILASKDIEHGPIECLFTVDEETGLTGAFGLKPGFLNSRILLNLDSEDEGELFIGCAGGKDTVVTFNYSRDKFPEHHESFKISVSGLVGGHSGDDIQKGRGNANKILNRMLWYATDHFNMKLCDFNGGNLRNAIAREAFAIVAIPTENANAFSTYIAEFHKIARFEYKVTEVDLKIALSNVAPPAHIMNANTQKKLINSVYGCPHGVIAWSADIPNFVETSTNLASVKVNENSIVVTTSQRSSVESAKDDICNMVASVFRLAGADEIKHTDGYPGWTPDPNSAIVDITANSYRELFNEEPKVLAIHAGLECGLIGDVYPEMDMISFGPTIKGAHSPDERLKIDTVIKFWDLTLDVLKKIPVQ
jgi:dipeptidase D